MRPRPRWPASSAPSRTTSATPPTCCASCATIAAPPMATRTATRSCRSTRCRSIASDLKQPELVDACPRRLGPRLELGEQHGYRNAQATVIAPTGTIGLVMDCDTTGIEPDFALVKFKKLAGGGYFKIINRAVPEALRTLGYSESQIAEIEAYAVGHGNLNQAPAVNPGSLKAKGFTDDKIALVNAALKSAFDIKFVFNQWTLGADWVKETFGFTDEQLERRVVRHAGVARLLQEGHRGRQHPCLRRHDARGRAVPQGRAPAGVRLRQSVRQDRQALPLGRKPHPHDGGGAALHLGRHLQDHQHAERRDRRRLQERLHAVVEAGAEGQRALPRRLQAQPAAQCLAARRRG